MHIGTAPAARSNGVVSKKVNTILIGGWIAFMAIFWIVLSMGDHSFIPGPAKVSTAFLSEWQTGSVYQLLTSTILSFEAVAISSVIGLGLVYLASSPILKRYLSTIAFFRPPVDWIGKFRFLSLTGVLVVFIMLAPNGHVLKLSVLTFSVVVFLVNNMLQVIDDIPASRFDYARTLGLSDWQVLREVVIRGTLADAFETIRMNAAMAWMMLTMVEGLSRSEGGVGVLLLSLQRSGNYAAIFAIQLMILLVGMGQDRLIKIIKGIACPYTVRS